MTQKTHVFHQDDICWQVHPSYAEKWPHFSWQNLQQNKEIIKTSPAREVSFTSDSQTNFVLKIYHTPKWSDVAKTILTGTRAAIEWKYLCQLQDLGISVPQAVACGKRGRTSFLLMERLENVDSLFDVVQMNLSWQQRRKIAYDLAILMANLHHNGILHLDLHYKNFLLNKDHKIYLLDLHCIQEKPRLSQAQQLKNLGMLGSCLTSYANTPDYLAFAKVYHDNNPTFSQIPHRRFLHLALSAMNGYHQEFWNRRVRRCIRNNRYYGKIPTSVGTGMYCRDFPTSEKFWKGLENHKKSGNVLKNSRSSFVADCPEGILKQYRRKKLRRLFLDCFRYSRAKRAWLAGYHLQLREIPTAAPKSFCDHRLGPILQTSYLLAEKVEGESLWDYGKKFADCEGSLFKEKQVLLRNFGRLIRKLHYRGLGHRDLKGNNFLINNGKIVLIDLDGLIVAPQLRINKRKKDLARLLRDIKRNPAFTQTDILRVLQGYLAYNFQTEWREWYSFFDQKYK